MAAPARVKTWLLAFRAIVRLVTGLLSGRVRVAYPDGHFYSPIPDLNEVRRHRQRVFALPKDLPGIDLRESEQLALIDDLADFALDAPFTSRADGRYRYYYENEYFGQGDALVLHALLRQRSPRLVIEVGSGFSSALILDTTDQWLPDSRLIFVEPYPKRLRGLLRRDDARRAEIIESAVQDVDLEVFGDLDAGDFLIIDSTHVAKVGSDVTTLLFDVLPRLRPGVLVHVHDIFYPFEYPEEWVLQGRAWNEAYLLRAFLTDNVGFRITLWNSYLAAFHRPHVGRKIPMWLANPGGSLWLERTEAVC